MKTFNRAIELHDSDVETVCVGKDGCLTLVFSSAYIHESEGVPGINKGRGLVQGATLEIERGEIVQNASSLPSTISDGFFIFDGKQTDNMIPLPFDRRGDFRIELTLVSGEKLHLRGISAKLTLHGDAVYIEDFPGT